MTPREQMKAVLPRFDGTVYLPEYNGAPRLYSRREIPTWCEPLPDTAGRFSIFWGNAADVREYVFTCDKRGVVFQGEYGHSVLESREIKRGTYHLPADVLIAAGVEARRRA